ncbi:MAG: PLP-dependent aminotransferase family protein [Hyphomicrobiaceae bacterium]|nr:PLP-dependent aminotransferase family protein [Hyphomicrobiaceae bacterium]
MRVWEPAYAARAERMRASEIRELLKLLEQPGIVSFAGGIPDPALFPVEEARAAYAAVLTDPALAGSGLQYSVSEGYLPLRQWIVQHMGRLGVACEVDNIVITSGSQQALDFLGRMLLSPGDTALVTAPTYLGALQAFSAYEPHYDELRPEDGNRTAGSYAQAATVAGGRVKFAYVVPDFANPTGETLSLAARRRLLDLAAELDVPLIEDAAYAALRFEGAALPSLMRLEIERRGSIEAARSIYCGTFSKVLSPGLRVGWIVAPTPMIRRLVLVKQASDLNNATINQMVMYRLAEQAYDDQVQRACGHYRRRRDAMLAALKRHMRGDVAWSEPKGGLFAWVRLPDTIDTAGLLDRAVEEARVAFVPGAAFFHDGGGRSALRLSYSLADEAQIEAGIARLARLI